MVCSGYRANHLKWLPPALLQILTLLLLHSLVATPTLAVKLLNIF